MADRVSQVAVEVLAQPTPALRTTTLAVEVLHSTTSPHIAYANEVLADAPIVYLKMDDTSGTAAVDSGSHAVDGAYTNGPVVNTTAGGANGGLGPAVTFDGTDDFVTIPDHVDLRITGDHTLEAWVYPTSFGNYRMLWTKVLNDGGEFQWMLFPTSGLPSVRNGTGTDFFGERAPTLNQWNHIAVTKSGLVFTHWLNAKFNGAHTLASNGASASTEPLRFGRRSNYNFYYQGRAMQAAIYTTALTQARFQARFDALTGGALRATQAAAEALYAPAEGLRVSQLAIEALYAPAEGLRVSQLAIEVLYSDTAVLGGGRSQIIIVG